MPDPSSGVNGSRWNGLAGAKSITLTKKVATSDVIAATYGRYARWRRLVNSCVKAPMEALLAQLEPEFGTAKFFRPYRDVRFAKGASPYKDHQGAFVEAVSAL